MSLASEAAGAVKNVFVKAPFQAAAVLRGHRRVFHPRGLLVTGHIELESSWWTLPTGTPLLVQARLSGGVGTPSTAPDVLGIALKIPLDPDAEWDLLLVSSGTSAMTRVLPLPARGWERAHYSSLMPYASRDSDVRWVLAEPTGTQPETTDLDELRRTISEAPLRFELQLVSFGGTPEPAGTVTLTRVQDVPNDDQPAFEPVVHHPPGLTLRPKWLAQVRSSAYRGSRSGRDAPHISGIYR